MRKFIYHIKSLLFCQLALVLVAALSLTACDDKNDGDYVPGEPTPSGSMQVYFDASNAADFITAPGENAPVEITVSRENADEAAEVPIICKSVAEGLTIPTSVKFEAGKKTTTLTIDVGSLEENKKYQFSLAIGDEYADHYTKLNGSSTYSGYVMEASWNTYVKDATMTWTVGGTKQTWTRDIERLGSTNRYRIKDFVGSGLDMVFTEEGPASGADMDGYNKIVPYTNSYAYNDGTVDGYYLYDSNKGEYPSWTLGDKTISYLCIMTSYIGSGDYSYISFEKGYVCFGTYYTDYSDGTSDSYNYIELEFTPQN